MSTNGADNQHTTLSQLHQHENQCTLKVHEALFLNATVSCEMCGVPVFHNFVLPIGTFAGLESALGDPQLVNGSPEAYYFGTPRLASTYQKWKCASCQFCATDWQHRQTPLCNV
jgi:hypothetical protein